eukprot:344899-Hanusia_phi.AAC.1
MLIGQGTRAQRLGSDPGGPAPAAIRVTTCQVATSCGRTVPGTVTEATVRGTVLRYPAVGRGGPADPIRSPGLAVGSDRHRAG